ncbi:MAG: helix-turn-helix transcriptional regulator [bacterium]|nr:helix-turn-helix transcriptional regulator [bacterium]
MSKYEIDLEDQGELEKFSNIFKALSNPGRLRILLELAKAMPQEGYCGTNEEQENCQQDFAECLGLAQSTVSHHFKELRLAGLLHSKREGKQTIIWVDKDVLESIRKLLE